MAWLIGVCAVLVVSNLHMVYRIEMLKIDIEFLTAKNKIAEEHLHNLIDKLKKKG